MASMGAWSHKPGGGAGTPAQGADVEMPFLWSGGKLANGQHMSEVRPSTRHECVTQQWLGPELDHVEEAACRRRAGGNTCSSHGQHGHRGADQGGAPDGAGSTEAAGRGPTESSTGDAGRQSGEARNGGHTAQEQASHGCGGDESRSGAGDPAWWGGKWPRPRRGRSSSTAATKGATELRPRCDQRLFLSPRPEIQNLRKN